MEGRRYDSMEGIGRVESGTETENNARSNCREQRRTMFTEEQVSREGKDSP